MDQELVDQIWVVLKSTVVPTPEEQAMVDACNAETFVDFMDQVEAMDLVSAVRVMKLLRPNGKLMLVRGEGNPANLQRFIEWTQKHKSVIFAPLAD